MADDQTRDGPPAHRAENWSRRDNIRAGAVSGPWRSAPREDGGEPPVRGDPRAAPAAPPLAWTGRSPAEPAARRPEEDGPPVARVTGASAVRPKKRGRGSVILGVIGGATVAAAIVAAALLLRPQPDARAPQESAENAAQPVEGPAPASEATVAPEVLPVSTPPLPAGTEGGLRLRVGPELPAARQAAVLDALEAGGAGEVLVEQLPFRIAVSRVGYYHEADRDAAAQLAERMSEVLREPGGPLAIRDYSKLLPDAQQGRLDLWISDQSGDG